MAAVFSLNEFARLIVLLRDDERAKMALGTAIGVELTRAQLDVNVTRDSFWKTIEDRFNDASVDIRKCFAGRVDEIDSNERTKAFRSASVLRNQFNHVRKLFSIVRDKSVASGQNDVSRITQFLKYTTNGELTAESKRVYIFFTVCRVGTAAEDTNILRNDSKLIEEYEAGYEDGIPLSQSEPARQSPLKNTKRESSDLREDFDLLSKSFIRLGSPPEARTAIMREHLELQRARSTTTDNVDNRIMSEMDLSNRLMQLYEQAVMRYERALKMNNAMFVKDAKEAMDLAKKQYDSVRLKIKNSTSANIRNHGPAET
ncbi:unnamed protein product [Agarophyton chilense]